MKKILLSMFVMLASTSTWAQTFTADGETLTIMVTNEASAAKVAEAMQGDKYSKVIVSGGGTINNEFVQSILYTQWSVNSKVETLDLGDVALENGIVNKGFYIPLENDWRMNNLHVSTLVLPNNVTEIGQSAFETMKSPSKVVFPATLVKIGDKAFANSNLTSVDFPASLRWIGNQAFATNRKDGNNNVITFRDIKLNDGLEYIGNSAFALGSKLELKTLDIPASVKYIGPGAFSYRQYQELYFRGAEAPLCPIGTSLLNPGLGLQSAFGSETLMGNNGFNPNALGLAGDANTGKANRENYKNNGVYFCILHYPTNLTAEQEAKYTDITKKYETWEGNEWGATSGFYYGSSKVVGKESGSLTFNGYEANGGKVNPGYKDTYLGDQYIWPSQTQWMRSYLTASNGVCWDGVTAYRPTLTAEQIALLRKAGYSEAEYSVDDLAKIAFVGTRQFVLGNGNVKSQGHDYTINVKGGKWNTLCVPFNMTKKMVDETLGQGTQVCRFSFVDRKFDNKAGNHITLLFRNDVYKHKTEKIDGEYEEFDANAEAPGDDDIVIYAHEAYMVKPTKTDEDPKAFLVDMFEAEPGSPLPTYVCAKNREIVNGFELQADDDVCRYRFIGHYQASTKSTYTLAPNVYYFGRLKASDPGKFWFYNGKKVVKWNANSCIIQQEDTEIGEQDAESFFNVRPGESASAKQSSLFGDMELEGNTTGVEHIEIVAGENAEAIVYSLDGQVVNRNGETNHLPNGIYVKNGKKFIVK